MIGLVSSSSVDRARCHVGAFATVSFSPAVLRVARAAVLASAYPPVRGRSFSPNLKLWHAQRGATWAKL
jgi:hypothetical protein